MPARGPLTCDQLEKRHNNGRTERGRNRSLSSAIRKGCAWASSKPAPNPCEPKPRAFVTKAKEREVAFMVSGGDCPPGVRADPTEADKQRIKDAAASCTGTRPSSSFKQCVVDALKAMAEPKRASKAQAPSALVPMAPPRFTIQQLPPELVKAAQKTPPVIPTTPAPPPMQPPRAAMVRVGMFGGDMPPLLGKPPPAPPVKPKKIPKQLRPKYREAVDKMLRQDWPLRVPKDQFEVADEEFYNYIRRSYPEIPACDRIFLRRNPTLGYMTEAPALRFDLADRLVNEYGED